MFYEKSGYLIIIIVFLTGFLWTLLKLEARWMECQSKTQCCLTCARILSLLSASPTSTEPLMESVTMSRIPPGGSLGQHTSGYCNLCIKTVSRKTERFPSYVFCCYVTSLMIASNTGSIYWQRRFAASVDNSVVFCFSQICIVLYLIILYWWLPSCPHNCDSVTAGSYVLPIPI